MAQRELVNKEVSKVFEAIFNRITLNDLNFIIAAKRDANVAALNHGNSEQLRTQKQLDLMIDIAVNNIIDHDMSTILKVLSESELLIRLSSKALDEKN